MERERTAAAKATAERGDRAGAALELRDVHRHFGGKPVLAGLDLAVRPGECVALLGRNGAGKTTALRVLLGFLAPHRGETRVLGAPSAALPPAARARIGYVPEDPRALAGLPLTVAELVAFEAATRPGLAAERVRAELERLDLPADRAVALLSRGQRTQLALVLALAEEPDVLVFDDPALGLDPVVRRALLETVIDYLAEKGCAVLFSSHVLTDVERLADRVAVLHEGRLVVDERLDALKRRVTRRELRVGAGASAEALAAELAQRPAVLRARAAEAPADAVELWLVDADAALERELAALGRLSAPLVPSLEELFCALTGARDGGGPAARAGTDDANAGARDAEPTEVIP